MLPAHLLELLTASVDGELTPDERRMVDKLLRDSEEARRYHAGLTSDAQLLKRMPRVGPADDLAASIMNLIDDRGMMPTPLPTPRKRNVWNPERYLPWISMATAAGVVIVVSLYSYVYFAASERQRHLVNQEKQEKADVILPAPVPASKDIAKANRRNPSKVGPLARKNGPEISEDDPIDDDPENVGPMIAKEKSPPAAEIVPVMPRVVGLENVVATPALPESEPFQVVKIRLSLLLPLKDLDQAYPKLQLRDELKKDEVIRLDLFCKESSRAAELVQNALKARGQQVLIDALAHDRLKKKQKSEYVFYTECMTAEEVAQFLEHLGAEDKKLEAKKAGEGHFDKFMLAPFLAADLNELAKLLGLPAGKINLPKPKVTGVDPRKSLESLTAAQLAQNLPKGGSRGPEKIALVLPYGATNHFPQNSKEIKTFLDKRGDRKPGSVPMMLVLRMIN